MNTPLKRSSLRPRLMGVALSEAEAGHFVLPLAPRSQIPPQHFRDWETAATRDPRKIEQWWSSRPYNVAIACGPSGLLVVDLDPSHGDQPPPQWAGDRSGLDVFSRLLDAAGQPWPETYAVATPSGGQHLYFQAPEEPKLRNTQGRLGWRIDTRGHGGYIVAAGSVRPHGSYRLLRRAPIMALPEWLVLALTPPPPSEATTLHLPAGKVGPYAAAALRSEADKVRNAIPGTRHHTLISAAGKLGQLVGAGALDEQTVTNALLAATEPHIGVQRFTLREASKTIADGLKWGQDHPRDLIQGQPPHSNSYVRVPPPRSSEH